MNAIKRIAMRLLFRAFVIFYGLILAPCLIMAAPWAWMNSKSQWGWTTWREWKDAWRVYSLESLRHTGHLLISSLIKTRDA